MKKLYSRFHHWFVEGNDHKQSVEYADLKDQYDEALEKSHKLEDNLADAEAAVMQTNFTRDRVIAEVRASDRILSNLKYAIAQMES